jgi:hypothetical protein
MATHAQHLDSGTAPAPGGSAGSPKLRVVARLTHGIGQAVMMLLPLVIVAVFFWLQGQISGLVAGCPGNVLIAVSVVTEIALVMVWSRFAR